MGIKENLKKEKKKHIIAAAATVFSKKGFSGASIAEIAVTANIGKGTIYEYFDSKEDLFFAVFEWYVNKTSSALRVNVSALGGSAAQRLEAISDAIMNMWDEIQDIFALTMEFWAASSASQMRHQFQEAFKKLYLDLRKIIASLIQDC